MDTKNDDLQEDQITQTDDTNDDDVTTVSDDTQDDNADVATDATDDDSSAPAAVDETTEDEDKPAEEEEVLYATPNALKDPASQGVVTTPAETLINLESLINRHVVDIEKVKEQLKTQKDMFNDTFGNDAVYAELDQKVKDLNRQKNGAKQKLLKQPGLVSTSERILELKEDMKDLQEALSAYLRQYQEISKTNQIVGENGEIREIVTSHKLVKKGGKFRP